MFVHNKKKRGLTDIGRKRGDKNHVRVNQGNNGLVHGWIRVLEKVRHPVRLVVEQEPAEVIM